MNQLESALLLNSIPDIGPVRFKSLKEHFGNLSQVFQSSVSDLRAVEGISENLARKILAAAGGKAVSVEKELKSCDVHGIRILTLEDSQYPSLLRTLVNPPPLLYCKGRIEILTEPSLAVVGTRKPTPYGEKVAAQFSRELSDLNLVLVSGMARGIDTVVHRATLEARGKTIAVLGSGLLKIYPPENRGLAGSIAGSGLLVSEFPLESSPEPGHFPQRNRIIAGISLGTVVIEADEHSGALITARLAAEQGKDVFAVPGPITSKMSLGPHRLIKEGAKLAQTVDDILEEIALLKDSLFDRSKKRPPAGSSQNDAGGSRTLEEKKILELIGMEPLPIDALLSQSKLSPGEFSKTLLSLELKGTVRSLPGKRYVRN